MTNLSAISSILTPDNIRVLSIHAKTVSMDTIQMVVDINIDLPTNSTCRSNESCARFCFILCDYNYIMSSCGIITVMSQWARWRLKSPALRLFTQPFIQVQIKENIKAPRLWPLCGEFTGDFPAQMASNAENVSIWWRHNYEISWLHQWQRSRPRAHFTNMLAL